MVRDAGLWPAPHHEGLTQRLRLMVTVYRTIAPMTGRRGPEPGGFVA